MASSQHAQVVIVGGGIGGLTLAAILRRLKISHIVLERSEKLTIGGAGISLAPNALKLLDQIGVYDGIKREGQRLHTMLVHYNDKKWRELDFSGAEARYGYPLYSIERQRLYCMLLKAAGGAECIQWGAKVVDIVDDVKENHVTVKVASGEQYTAGLVVGADGIRSITRRILAQRAGLEGINSIRFTGLVHMSGFTKPMPNLGKEHLGVGNWLFYDDAILTTWPCKDNSQWFIGVKRVPVGEKEPDHSVWEGTTPEMIKEVYGKKFHPFGANKTVGDIIDNAERVIASNVFEEKDFPTMVSGRVVLLGDAAHSMTSFFGQGGCQAIEDAAELANALTAHYASPTASSLQSELATYATVRGKRGKDLVTFSGCYALIHIARLPWGLGPYARKLLYAWLPVWCWMLLVDWLYGYQPTVKNLPFKALPGDVPIGLTKVEMQVVEA